MLSSGGYSREINWQEFRTNYLAKGEVCFPETVALLNAKTNSIALSEVFMLCFEQVEKLVVVNKSFVRVYLKGDPYNVSLLGHPFRKSSA